MRKKIIAFDIDDVILNLVPHWIGKYNIDFNDNVKVDDILDWDISKYVRCGKDIYNYLLPSLYENIPLVEGSILGVGEIRKLARVIFVTSNAGNCSGIKFHTLNKYGFDVNKKDYFECEDKSLIASDYLIDDNDSNVQNAYGQGILFTRPWNRSSLSTPRVGNWFEICRYMRKESVSW